MHIVAFAIDYTGSEDKSIKIETAMYVDKNDDWNIL